MSKHPLALLTLGAVCALASPGWAHAPNAEPGAPPMIELTSSRDLKMLWLQAPAAGGESQPQSQAQQQKPTEGQQAGKVPSLQGLGFPASEIHGSTAEQALLDKRSHMLQIHQKLGLITTIPMFAALFTGPGAKGHRGLPGSPSRRDLHAALGFTAAGMYFATAYFALRVPKVAGTRSYGLIRLHKALVWIHLPGMILTPILGTIAFRQLSRGERVHGIARYHSWVAVTTAGAYGLALLSVTFK